MSTHNNAPPADAIPIELLAQRRWLCWRYETRDGKATKVPYRARADGLTKAKSTDSATWTDHEAAVAAVAANPKLDGLGFALGDGLVGVDLDHAIDPETGEVAEWASAIVDLLSSWTEVSPSGTGLHIIARGTLPDGSRNKVGMPGGGTLEVYTGGRYFTVTGRRFGACETVEERAEQLAQLAQWHLGMKPPTGQRGERPTAPEVSLDADFPQRKHDALLKADRRYEKTWNHQRPDLADQSLSVFDLALCSLAAQYEGWTDQELAALIRGHRSKWGETQKALRRDYISRTVVRARAGAKAEPSPGHNGRPGHERQPDLELRPSPPERSRARTDARKLLDVDLRGAHPASDVGLGRLLGAIAKDRLIWTDGRGWLAFDGKRWAPPAKSATGAAARFFPEALLLTAAAIRDDGDRRAAFTKAAQHAHRERAIAAALNLAAIDLAAPDEDLDADPWLLTTANGTLELRTGKLLPHSPADLITRLAPVAYDPGAEAPVWAEFLATVLPDPEVRHYLQRAIGYTLTGTTRERCLWICHGRTRSGRTTLFETLRDLLGEYARDVSSDAFLLSGDRDDDARAAIQLVGVRMACAAELGEERTLRENLAKLVTGGQDRIPARAMYRDVTEYRPEAKLFLRTNHKPRITGTDEAIWSRVRLIEFPWQCPEQDQDRDLGDKLAAEHSGILNWALRGTAQWLDHGLGTPTEVAAATSRYRGAEDVLADWLAEHTAAGGETLASLLYANYRAWAEGQGFRVVSAKAFGLGLADRGFEVHRGTRGVRYWQGLSLKGAPYITRGSDPEDQSPQGGQPEHHE